MIPKIRGLFKLLFWTILWVTNGCTEIGQPVNPQISKNHYYTKAGDEVVYSSLGNWFELGNAAMSVDIESFEVLTPQLSRDVNRMYVRSFVLSKPPELDLDALSFRTGPTYELLGFDDDHVYAFQWETLDQQTQGTMQVVPKADPKHYKVLNFQGWASDGEHLYFEHELVDLNAKSVDFVASHLVIDSARAFIRVGDVWQPLIKVDVPSLEALEGGHALDDQRLYYVNSYEDPMVLYEIEHNGKEQVEMLSSIYGIVDGQAYALGKPLAGAQPERLRLVGQDYAVDERRVYYFDQPVVGADPKTFRQLEDRYAFADRYGEIRDGRRVE